MTLKDYFASCQAFAADTSAWGGLDPYTQYVAIPCGKWVETCDNQEGGIPLAWAFGIPAESINPAAAKEYYLDEYRSLLTLANDDEWDDSQRRSIYETFEDCVENRENYIFCDQWDAVVNLMDGEISEQLHAELAPCTNQEFFTAYEKAHEEKYGEPWELSKENPTW